MADAEVKADVEAVAEVDAAAVGVAGKSIGTNLLNLTLRAQLGRVARS